MCRRRAEYKCLLAPTGLNFHPRSRHSWRLPTVGRKRLILPVMTNPNLSARLLHTLNLEAPALRQVGLKLAKVDGVNLAQGLCLLPTPTLVKEAACEAVRNGKNIYAPAQGIPELREAVAKRVREFNKLPEVTAERVLITPGSTGAFESVCACFLEKGDEVASFIPFYPYHRNALHRIGVKTNYVPLHAPEWDFEKQELERAITPRTKAILIVNPNNPTGKVYSRGELASIAEICKERDLLCIADEVYEYMTYDGTEHISIASLPGMFERTITMSSYSKTFAITGWRIGFLSAPNSVIDALRTASDSIYVCAPTPFQYAVARGIAELPDGYYRELQQSYERKRNALFAGLKAVGLNPRKPQGAYYMLASTAERFPGKSSEEVVDILIDRARLGAVPASDFIGPESKRNPALSNFLRFSFGVPDETVAEAVRRLAQL